MRKQVRTKGITNADRVRMCMDMLVQLQQAVLSTQKHPRTPEAWQATHLLSKVEQAVNQEWPEEPQHVPTPIGSRELKKLING